MHSFWNRGIYTSCKGIGSNVNAIVRLDSELAYDEIVVQEEILSDILFFIYVYRIYFQKISMVMLHFPSQTYL